MKDNLGGRLTYDDIRASVDKIVAASLREDIGKGDITSNSIFTDENKSSFSLFSKDRGVLAGIEIFKEVFRQVDSDVRIENSYRDGDVLDYRDVVATVSGRTKSILTAERVALNFLGHLSGVASKTKEAVDSVSEYNIKILDTRKTLPMFRMMQKYAVCVGGGHNHRLRLDSMFLIKDNHIKACGSIKESIKRARENNPKKLEIEIEVSNLEELNEAFKYRPDIIMLDNMDDIQIKKAKELVGRLVKLEVSGNIGVGRLLSLARAGVDYVSMGGLTHSVRAFDFSLKG